MSGAPADGAGDVRAPVTTYRLQLRPGLGFEEAAALAPALAGLGVTDLYLSPCFQARPGSPHGYDLADHNRLSADLGGEAGWAVLRGSLGRLGMGAILDFVPNHMGVDDPRANAWWWDVLENGNCSPYAQFFDIDWDPLKPELRGKLLLPVLGDQYGRVLDRGELRLDYEDGALLLRYYERSFPINPRRAPLVLGRDLPALEARMGESDPDLREFLSVLTALGNLPSVLETERARVMERHREKEVARERLARLTERSAAIREHVEATVAACNGRPGDRASFAGLHELLEHQPYRLAYWRTAFHEINYRRFFDVNALVSLRMEDPEVFETAHRLLLRLVGEGAVSGIRLDHIDGLSDPRAYLERLSHELRRVLRPGDPSGGPGGSGDEPPLYVVVEKILSPGERLPERWAMHGTTGYDFLNEVNGLFVDARGQRPLQKIFESFTRRHGVFEDVEYQSKKVVMESAMAGELNMLAHAINIISESDPHSRDFTLNSLRDMLTEVVACFPVYRTYVEGDHDEENARLIRLAIARAIERNPGEDASVFAFFEDVALGRGSDELPEPEQRRRREFILKLQQYTAPVHAKGVEDTAFYRHFPLLSLNEVGGAPQRFGVEVADFHAANRLRRERWPRTMLCTSTHDTKRGEDARARIDVLSEIPDEWRRLLSRWSRLNAANRTGIGGTWAPDRGDEYLFYQALLGAWPAEGLDPAALAERMSAYMLKAIREAKLHTSWIQADAEYERHTTRFVDQCLTGRRAGGFLESFAPFAARVARVGAVNSLAQLVLKIASPGVPDFYQGTELWDLSLVDPDNRRPVDFELRRAMFERLAPAVEGAMPPVQREAFARERMEGWQDGAIKMYVTACAMRLRRARSATFLEGDYVPLEVSGERAPNVVAFARVRGDDRVLVVVPRLVYALAHGAPPLGVEAWGDTVVHLPDSVAGPEFEDVFTGMACSTSPSTHGETLRVAGLLSTLPVALLGSRAS